jgi:hypothetical protein
MTGPMEPHSHALPGDGAKLMAPSVARNLDPIRSLLTRVAPRRGSALELASGTGQHVVALAARLPGLTWQPTEIDPARRASISAYVAEAKLPNILPPLALDVSVPGWGKAHGGQALIFLSNLLHLITMPTTQTLITEAVQALVPGGRLVIYGPFMRAGKLTSEGDSTFHASLIAQDVGIGYKDDMEIKDMIRAAGLKIMQVVEMPANNLGLVANAPLT